MVLSQNDKDTINNLYSKKENDEQFIKSILNHLKTKYLNEGTRSNKLSLYKKYVKISNMISPNNINKIGDDTLRRKLNRERENRQEPGKVKLNISVIDKIIDFKDEENSEKLLIFLLFATGRRISEFLNGVWTIRNGKLFIDKISKKRDDIVPTPEGYEIKLIDKITPEQFLALLTKFKTNNRRQSTEAVRKAINRTIKKLNIKPIDKVKDLRPLYVQYLKTYDKDIKNQNGNQAIKNILHHDRKSTSILYNDKFDIISRIPDNINKLKNRELRQLLEGNGINKNNTKGFNKLKKSRLIELIMKHLS